MTDPFPARRNTAARTRRQPAASWSPHVIALACAATLALLAAGPAHAQTASASVASTARLSLPSQPLAQTLGAIARQFATSVGGEASLLEGKTAPAVQGALTLQQALGQALAGSGLAGVQEGNAVVVKAAAPAAAATTLPVVTVVAATDQENASGPVKGYVATRSASGTKTDAALLETPQSITVVTRDQMTAQGAQTVGEALRYTAGVVAEEYGGTDLRIDQYVLRGFASSMPYLDGLTTGGRYTLMSENVDAYGLERVEVLRGPSSVLYGQNIPGGLVNLVSKRPTDTAFGEIGLQYGSFDHKQLNFDVGGPIGDSGKLSYRLTGLVRDTDTQVDRVGARRYYLAPSLTYKPSSDTTLTVFAKVQRQQDGYSLQYLPADGTLYPSPYGQLSTRLFTGEPAFNRVDRTQSSLGYSLEHRIDDVWTVRQNVRVSRTQTDLGYVYATGLVPDTTLLDRYTIAANAHQNNVAVDTQAQARFKTGAVQHTALLGVDYFRSHDRWVESDGTASPLDTRFPVYGQPFTVPAVDFATDDTLRQTGVYMQDQMRIGHLILTGSLRHDWATTSVTDLLASSTTLQKDEKTTGRAGVVYLFDNGWAPYASYSTSFNPALGTAFDGSPFKPTTAKQYEAGVKYQPPGSTSLLTLSAYQLTQRNGLTADPDHEFFQVQTGEVRVRGGELSGAIDLARGLKAVATYSYTDADITRSNDGNVGNTPANVPRQMASLWLEQRFSGALAGWRAGIGARYLGTRYGDDANTLRLRQTTLVDAMIGYDFPHWSLALNARNLADKTYVATCENEGRCVYGQRRSVLATATYRW